MSGADYLSKTEKAHFQWKCYKNEMAYHNGAFKGAIVNAYSTMLPWSILFAVCDASSPLSAVKAGSIFLGMSVFVHLCLSGQCNDYVKKSREFKRLRESRQTPTGNDMDRLLDMSLSTSPIMPRWIYKYETKKKNVKDHKSVFFPVQ